MGSACSSAPSVKQQKYAELKTERTFEYPFAAVWAGIESALSGVGAAIDKVDPASVGGEQGWDKLQSRRLESKWVYRQSRDKYIEYKINGLPKKQYLQTRTRYEVTASRVLGGIRVAVDLNEEVERVDQLGNPTGYVQAERPDTARANELIEKTYQAIRASGTPSL